MHFALRIMSLKGECTTGEKMSLLTCRGFVVIGLCIVYDRFVVDFYNYMLTLHFDVFSEPFHVLHIGFFYVNNIVQTSCALPVSMRIVYLDFESFFRPAAFLVLRMKIDARIGTRICHYIHFQFEIFKIMILVIA